MSKKYIICRNRKLKKREDHHFDLYRSDLDAGCTPCYFMKCNRGKHYSDDWAHCTCGIQVKYGDKIEVIMATSEKTRLIKQRKKKSC